jgi:polynucleotide 5'-kinase involved in rRNA processing
LNSGEFLVGNTNSSSFYYVRFSSLKNINQFVGGIIEHSGFNLTIGLIHQLNFEKMTFTSGIFVMLEIIFLDNLRFK